MFPMSKIKLIDKETIEKIHEGTCEVLEKAGVNFHHESAQKIFKDAGCTVDGCNVKIPRNVFEKALSQTPSSFTMHGIDPKYTFVVGEGQERIHTDPNFGTIIIHEHGKGYREPTMEDLAINNKLLQASEIVDIAGGIPVECTDVPTVGRHLHYFREILRHTTKPFRSYVESYENLQEMFTMFEMVQGTKGYLDNHTCMFVSINPLSPLAYDSHPAQTLIAMAEKHQAVCTLTAAISGFTSPMSILGTAVMQNAEMLAGNTLMQLVNPGAPYMLGPASARPDMRTGLYANGSPEANLINISSMQVAKELYNIPTRTMAGLTDAKVTDAQAGMETMQTLMTAMLGGADVIHGCMASMDSLNLTSFEKFVISEEAFSRVMRTQKGIYNYDTDLSVQEIIDTKPAGTYMMNDATLLNCSDTWRPIVSSQEPFAIWKDGGEKTIVDRALAKWKQMLADAPEMQISKALDDELGAYIKKCGY